MDAIFVIGLEVFIIGLGFVLGLGLGFGIIYLIYSKVLEIIDEREEKKRRIKMEKEKERLDKIKEGDI